MSTVLRTPKAGQSADQWEQRVGSGDWNAITAEVNEHGGALLPRLLTDAETETIRSLYQDDQNIRATINMSRHRFGAGEYRYFEVSYPEPVERLKQPLYPRMLPITRDWYAKLGRPAPWPDTLDEWLRMCHDAGQSKPTAVLLRYGQGDWNALHRDLYRDLVFPLQVVINLSEPGIDHTGGSSCWSSSDPARSPVAPPRYCRTATVPLHDQGPADQLRPRMATSSGTARGVGDPVRPAVHARARLPRRSTSSPKTYTLLGADGKPYQSAVKGQLGGHRRSRIYGRLDCPAALRAIAAGYRPCATCCPDRYQQWKSTRQPEST